METKNLSKKSKQSSSPIWQFTYWLLASLLMFFVFSNRYYDIQIRFLLSVLLISISYSTSWATNKYLIPNLLFKGKTFLFAYFLFALILLSIWFVSILISIILLYSIITLPNVDIPGREDVVILLTGTYTLSLLYSVFHFINESYRTNEEKQAIEKQKNTLELKLKEAQLQLLKEQIHPHFIFNMMNNLYALVNENADLSREVIVRLSDLLDFMLYECNTDWIPLGKEIEFINNYIELEKIRHDEDFNVTADFPKDLSGINVAPFIFFPFVENAFKHGLKQTSHDFISIKLGVTPYQIHFNIKNSMRNTDSTGATTGKNKGIGLRNVRERLELVYPDWHELKIESEENIFEITLNIKR